MFWREELLSARCNTTTPNAYRRALRIAFCSYLSHQLFKEKAPFESPYIPALCADTTHNTQSMPLIYAFVAVTKGPTKTILAEYTAYSGNFSTIATQVLLLLLLRDLSPATDTCGERRTDKMYSFSFHSNVTGFR